MTSSTEISRDPREGSALARFVRGFGYLLRGFDFVLRQHPSLFRYCLLPLLINLLVFAAVIVALVVFYGDLVNLIWARPDSWLFLVLWYVLYIFIFLLILLLGFVVFFALQALLAAPFNDLLSERVEQLAFGRTPPPFSLARLGRGLLLTMLHEVVKLGIYLGVMIPLFVFKLVVPVVGPVVMLLGGYYMTAVFFAYDYMDFSMTRREWIFARKWKVGKDNRALTLGLGTALILALLVPLLGLFAPPMAAVGGTLLLGDLERAGALQSSPTRDI